MNWADLERSLKQLPQPQRKSVAAFLQLLKEIQTRIQTQQSGAAAQQEILRLTGEIGLITEGKIERYQLLAGEWSEKQIPKHWLLQYLDAVNTLLLKRTFRDRVQLNQYIRQAFTNPANAAAMLLGGEKDRLGGLEKIAEAAAWSAFLENAASDLEQGRCYFPVNELSLAGVQLESAGADSEEFLGYLREQAANQSLALSDPHLEMLPDKSTRSWALSLIEERRAILETGRESPAALLRRANKKPGLFARIFGFR